MMKLLSLSSLLLTAAWTPALAAAPPSAPSFGEAVEVNVVNVDVYAVDKDGHRVTGLGKDYFELLEDGKKVAVSNFEEVEAGPAARSASPGSRPSGAPPAAAPEDDLSLVVYFDDFNIQPAHRERAIQQLRELLTRQLDPGTRVMLVTYDLGPHVRVPFTTDPADIEKGLREIETLATHGGETERDRKQAFTWSMDIQRDSVSDPTDPIPCPLSIATPARSYAAARRQEVLRTLSALTLMINSLSGVPGRKALLHVSDGIPMNPGEELFQFLIELCGGGNSGIANTPTPKVPKPSRRTGPERDAGPGEVDKPDPLTTYDSLSLGPRSYQAASQAMLDAQSFSVAKELKLLAAHANAQRVTLYTLQASGVEAPYGADAGAGPEDRLFQFASIGTSLRMNHREPLQLLADATGGRAILDANDFRPDLLRMREDLDSFYSLGFTPAHTGDGREHKIEVRARRPGLRLRYRQSYRDKPALEKVVDRTLAALFYGIEDNPLAITAEVGDLAPAENGQYAVPVRLKIPLFKLAILNQDNVYQGKLRLLVAVRNEGGDTAPMRQVEVPLNIPRKEVLNALGQYYIYTLTLKLKPGLQHVAVAVRDEIATTTSYLSRPVNVNATAAASHP
ncbi:MAG TPA: VWA domain-containing protein [Thermoanaerobaculia bacterium]|nr:VWA domain-containing protein [Thermoanaerobaculia bacterium]